MNRRKFSVEKTHMFTGHTDSIYSICEGPQDHLFFSASADGQVALWDLKTKSADGQLVARVQASVYAMQFCKQRNVLIIAQNFDGLHFLDWNNKKVIKSLQIDNSAVFDLKIYGEWLYAVTGSGFIYQIDLKNYSITQKLKLSSEKGRSIAINKYFIALGFSDNKIRIFSTPKFELVKEFDAHKNSVFSVVFSPNNSKLLSAGRDAKINVWDADNNFTHIEEIAAHMFTINHLTYNPDKTLFASCSMDKSIKIWDAATFKLLKVIDKGRHAGHGTSVNKLYWSAFNNELVSASDDTNLSVWKLHEINLNNN